MIKHHGANVDEILDNLGLKENKVIDFSSNTNAFIDKEKLKSIIENSLNDIFNYPDFRYKKAYTSLSGYWNIKEENILLTNGATEAIYLLLKTLNKENAVIIEPNFSEYEYACFVNKINTLHIPGNETNNYKILLHELRNIKFKNSVLIITNPNNPVGYTYSCNEILDICNYLELFDSHLILDESFIRFSNVGDNISTIKKCKNLIIIRSFTKDFSLPGIRIGALIADKNIIEKLKRIQPTWNVNSIAAKVIENISLFYEIFEESLIEFKKSKKELLENLTTIKKLKVFHSNSNYILFKIDETNNSKTLYEHCIERGIILRDCSMYRGLNKGYYRIAVRRSVENRNLISLIRSYIDG